MGMNRYTTKDRIISYVASLPRGAKTTASEAAAAIGGRCVTSDKVAAIFSGYCEDTMEFLPDKPNVKNSGGMWRKR